jgi:serine/threonine protein kinase
MERWKSIEAIEGGAQGDCFIVEDLAAPGKKYFMKRLKVDDNSERRRRFFIETTILKSVSLAGLATIVDTNSAFHEDKKIPLYYVAELIEGERLDKFFNARKQLPEDDVLTLFAQLLTILKACHEKDIVHRDVKPENIIVKESGELSLVDFGIAYHETEEQMGKTPVGQELGNRFLRLPEFAAGSMNKRDIRSDLSLAAGVALYLITGEYPRILIDAEGRMPHQTANASALIKQLKYAPFWNLVFDKAFHHNMAHRWNSADEILHNLQIVSMPEDHKVKELEKMLQLHAEALPLEEMARLSKALTNVYNQLHAIAYKILKPVNAFRQEEQQRVYQQGDTEKWCQVRSYPKGNKEVFQDLQVAPRALGEQIVGYIKLDGAEIEVWRGPYEHNFEVEELNAMEQIMQEPILNSLVKKLGK